MSTVNPNRSTRPCPACGGKRTCLWVDDAWWCKVCGSEWNEESSPDYAPPAPIIYKLARAICPECGKTFSVRPPEGGDGSADVFPRHTARGPRKTMSAFCPSSRMEVLSAYYVKD